MKSLHELKEMLCDELDNIVKRKEISVGSLDTIQKLTDSIKNIYKIEMLKEADEYSEERGSSYRRMYDDEDSYARRGRHYVRGHYSRDGEGVGGDGGSSYGRRGSYGRYSRADGKDSMMEKLEEIMEYADTDKQREAIRRCMSQLENA